MIIMIASYVKIVEDYVRTCDTCCRAKMPRHHPYGLLQPLPVPYGPWKSISIDFIIDLPSSKGYDAILIVWTSLRKWHIFFHVERLLLVMKRQIFLCKKLSSVVAFQIEIISDRLHNLL